MKLFNGYNSAIVSKFHNIALMLFDDHFFLFQTNQMCEKKIKAFEEA